MKNTFIAEDSDKTLLAFLSEKATGVGVSALKKQIKIGEVRVNGIKTRTDVPLKAGDTVTIFVPMKAVKEASVATVYEDDNIIVVCKPIATDTENNLVDILFEERGKRYIPVHRLDRNTEGLVILAKDVESEKLLLKAIKSREIIKTYRALLYGNPEKDEFEARAYLYKDKKNSLVTVTANKKDGGKEIITRYKIVEREKDFCVAEIELVTGRTHQIRAHSLFLGHPVIGDGKYTFGKASERGYKHQQLKAVKIVFKEIGGKLSYLKGKTITL